MAAAWAHWAAAVLYNGLGPLRGGGVGGAASHLGHACIPWLSMWALPELVEAAARAGDARARARRARAAGGDDAAVRHRLRARHRGALPGAAERGRGRRRLYREAIERLGRTRLRPELARAHLLYGEWLRRENRRVDARAQLRAAHEQFTSIGMEAFAERARRELLATGEKVRKRTVETRDDLTAQERQIAQLARDGLSNPEIGARLFLSPRTVEWHLRKVFAKLGIRSRHELANALAQLRVRAGPGLSSRVGVDSTTRRPRHRSRSLSVLSPSASSRATAPAAQDARTARRNRPRRAEAHCRRAASPGRRRTSCARSRRGRSARVARRSVDLVVELVVGDHPVDVSVLLRARSVEIVGDEQDLECPAATDQAGESGHRTAPGDHTRCRPRTGRGACSRARRTADRRPARTRFRRRGHVPDRGDADHRAHGTDATRRSSHACIPVGPSGECRGPARVVLHVVMGQVEIGVGAVEDDDVEVRILLDQANELGELQRRSSR